MLTRHLFLAAVIFVIAWGNCPADQSVTFQGLGSLPDKNSTSHPYAISDNGQIVIGYGYYRLTFPLNINPTKFVWDKQNGIRGLTNATCTDLNFSMTLSGDGSTLFGLDSQKLWCSWSSENGTKLLSGFPSGSSISCVSKNGSTICGNFQMNTNQNAFIWNANQGITDIGKIDDSYRQSRVSAMSGNCKTLAGYCVLPDDTIPLLETFIKKEEAFIWNADSGMQGLGWLSENHNYSTVAGISNDGTVIAGSSGYYNFADVSSETNMQAFIWDKKTGLQGLGTLPGTNTSYAKALSANGQYIIGNCYKNRGLVHSTADSEAFIWDNQNGMRSLGFLPDGISSEVDYIADDGSIVIGTCWISRKLSLPGDSPIFSMNTQTYIWTESLGMQSLDSILTANGIDLTGWSLGNVTGISSDGHILIGYGMNPAGLREGWVVTIPEPATIMLLAAAGMTMLRRQKIV